MTTRREARERALGLCYELETRGVDADDGRRRAAGVTRCRTPRRSCGASTEHRTEIDALLGTHSEHWALERMPAIDRALLRIGSYELGWEPEIPTAVVIDEAVDLANQYSTKDSGRFVNALARIADGRASCP